jgi:hypothetical protein
LGKSFSQWCSGFTGDESILPSVAPFYRREIAFTVNYIGLPYENGFARPQEPITAHPKLLPERKRLCGLRSAFTDVHVK